MKKLFISQPMRDKTDEEIKAERHKIIKAVTERFGKVEVIDSFLNQHHMMPSHYGFLVSLWNCFQQLTVLISQRAGKITEDARSSMNALCSMELTL